MQVKTDEEIQLEIDSFYKKNKSVILATKNENGEPYNSYTPFINHEGEFYIIISESAPHFDYINEHGEASFMLIDNEESVSNIFFRKRVSYYVKPVKVDVTEALKKAFVSKHGEMIDMVLNMDFYIYKMNRKHGKAVLGPAMAYFLDDNGNIKAQDDAKERKNKK